MKYLQAFSWSGKTFQAYRHIYPLLPQYCNVGLIPLAFVFFADKRDRGRQRDRKTVWLLDGCLTSLQHASVSLGQICSDRCMCCHTEIEIAGQTFYLAQLQYTDAGPTSPRSDPVMPGTWQGSHWSAIF